MKSVGGMYCDKIKFHTHWVGDQKLENNYTTGFYKGVKVLSPTSSLPA